MKLGLLRVGTLSVFVIFVLTVRQASGISQRVCVLVESAYHALCIRLYRQCLAKSTARSSSQRLDE